MEHRSLSISPFTTPEPFLVLSVVITQTFLKKIVYIEQDALSYIKT